jgi:hypothetical protein
VAWSEAVLGHDAGRGKGQQGRGVVEDAAGERGGGLREAVLAVAGPQTEVNVRPAGGPAPGCTGVKLAVRPAACAVARTISRKQDGAVGGGEAVGRADSRFPLIAAELGEPVPRLQPGSGQRGDELGAERFAGQQRLHGERVPGPDR